MMIVVFEGSAIVENGLEERVRKALRKMIREDDQITFYFYADNPFSLLCEWVVRGLRAAYPEKKIEVTAVLWRNEKRTFPAARFTSVERCEPEGGWRQMIDRADYVCCYVHPLLCTSRQRAAAYQYAEKTLGSRCVNFASQEAWEQICQSVPSLVRWERTAFEGRLQGRRKAALARELSVHPSTLRGYEIGACHSLVERVHTKERPTRRCAILDFASRTLPAWKAAYLKETLRYLVRCVSVNEFIVPAMAYDCHTQLMEILRQVNNETLLKFRIKTMKPQDNQKAAWTYREGSRTSYPYDTQADKCAPRLYEERRAMIDLADVVLCCTENNYRSGLSYAARKRTPVIDIAVFGAESAMKG